MDEIVKILPDQENYMIQTTLPSYVHVFLSHVPRNSVFIHKISVPVVQETMTSNESTVPSSSLDVTGSPLKFSVYSLQCEDTVLQVKNAWSSEEENHGSVALKEARKMITKLMLMLNNCDRTVWIACDGSDYKNTLLLAGGKSEGWNTRCLIMYKGKFSESNLQSKLTSYLGAENSMKCDVFCVKNLFESDDIERSVKGSVELVWHHPIIKVPKDGVHATLVLEGSVWSEFSKAYSLCCHLCLLHHYLIVLREAKTTGCTPELPPFLKRSSKHELTQILKILESKGNEMDDHCQPLGKDIFDLVLQVTKSQRPGHDITDKIWLLLAESENIEHMADTLNRILKAVRKHELKPQVSLTNCTFLAKTLTAIRRDLSIVVEVSSTEALRIMVETGIEKLRQDYLYIFKNLNVDCTLEFSNLVTDDCFDDAFQNLNTMAQLQATLDMLLITQTHLNLSFPSLSSFTKDLLNGCSREVTLQEAVSRNPFSVKIPINFSDVVNCLPKNFVTYRLTTSSTEQHLKDSSVLLYTRSPVFPPSIFKLNEGTEEEAVQKEQYFFYQLCSWSDKLKK